MKRVLASILVFSLLFVPLPSSAIEPRVLAQVQRSVVELQITNPDDPTEHATVCTGWVLAPERVVTAAHCIDEDYPITIDELPTKLLKIDVEVDLAYLQVDGLKRPYLRLRAKAVEVGETVDALGYPWNLKALVVLRRHVASLDLQGYEVVVDGTYAPGMSGGPVIDVTGQVVSVVQAGNSVVGFGPSVAEIKAFIR